MVMKVMSYFFASSQSFGVCIMVPSSSMISQQTPHWVRPARRSRSTVASVWPFLTSTPPRRAISGNTWPGRRKSSGFDAGSVHFIMVNDRSFAEIPVVVSTWSMETVNAVS